jgi:hypothetical protein
MCISTLITKTIVATDRACQQAKVKASVVKEVSGIGHQIIKDNMPAFRDDLKERVLAKVTAQLQK